MGEQCFWFGRDAGPAKPAKLSDSNLDDICESCQRGKAKGTGSVGGAAGSPTSVPTDALEVNRERLRYSGRRVLDSGATDKFRRRNGELVLELFFAKRGSSRRSVLWDAVCTMRKRWSIEATTRVPTLDPPDDLLYPEAADRGSSELGRCALQWQKDLRSMQEHLIRSGYPKRLLQSARSRAFLSACVLFDPPETDLGAFARLNDPLPQLFFGRPIEAVKEFEDSGAAKKVPVMEAAPIELLEDPEEVRRTERWFYESIIQEIGERHLKPLGLDIWAMYRDVRRNAPEIWAEYNKRDERNFPREYISVDELATKEDVGRAFDIIAALKPDRPDQHRGKRDRLIVVECTILHDRHGWSYEQLAERYGWQDPTRASKYIKDGRAALAGMS